ALPLRAFEIEEAPESAPNAAPSAQAHPPASSARPAQARALRAELGVALPAGVRLERWHLEIRGSDGQLQKELEGRGPLPAVVHFTGPAPGPGRHYYYALLAKTQAGAAYDRSGVLGRVRAGGRAEPMGRARVQPGDTLWSVAARPEVYGDPHLYFLLYDANRGRLARPDALRAGQWLLVPRGVSLAMKRKALRRAINR
ncbi:MAG TPA: LysM peptidoglycan-binding domain-containing protein, partial [bacterium]|nr:LysM peptidoglycan-binding domain-containing protein [bacterium]